MSQSESSDEGEFSVWDKPRIRQITGIRIHQLTLPEALPLASKLLPEPSPYHVDPPGESSRLTASPEIHPFELHPDGAGPLRTRRTSNSTLRESRRERSTSTSTIAAPLSPAHSRFRGPRERAPTLAGEAIELKSSGIDKRFSVQSLKEDVAVKTRRLARCFVVLKVSDDFRDTGDGGTSKASQGQGAYQNQREQANGGPNRKSEGTGQGKGTRNPLNLKVLPTETDGPLNGRHRAGSLQGTVNSDMPLKARSPILTRTFSDRATPGRRSTLSSRQDTPSPQRSLLSPQSRSRAASTSQRPNVPFYVSPIHHPSTNPRFLALTPETDFAGWMTTEQGAAQRMAIEVWFEDGDGKQWSRFEELCINLELGRLKKQRKDQILPPNTLQFTLGSDPRSIYWYPTSAPRGSTIKERDSSAHKREPKQRYQALPGVVERSMRETRMKRGVGVGGLHHLLTMHHAVVETERSIGDVQVKIGKLLREDADGRVIRRDTSQRTDTCAWIQDKIREVIKITDEVQARITLQKQALDRRRKTMESAGKQSNSLMAQTSEFRNSIESVEGERHSLVPLIHHWRTHHVQTLDAIFTIAPLHAPTLLYSILEVPLPIPTSARDPAPPLSLPAGLIPAGSPKVDERTTAAALGYAAMVAQILGHLGGTVGGLPYPITCAGSRSLVKDVVSVMQGPRSFPLYAKGVERYRYEYAVFLLNKDIEMLMQEANIRLVDVRHTLPNLKTLLLLLSSPLTSERPSMSRTSTYVDSIVSSRQTSYTSYTWPTPLGIVSPPSSSPGRNSPISSRAVDGPSLNTPTPLAKGQRSKLRPAITVARDIAQHLVEDEDNSDASGEGAVDLEKPSTSLPETEEMDLVE